MEHTILNPEPSEKPRERLARDVQKRGRTTWHYLRRPATVLAFHCGVLLAFNAGLLTLAVIIRASVPTHAQFQSMSLFAIPMAMVVLVGLLIGIGMLTLALCAGAGALALAVQQRWPGRIVAGSVLLLANLAVLAWYLLLFAGGSAS